VKQGFPAWKSLAFFLLSFIVCIHIEVLIIVNTNNLDQIRIHFILGKEQESFVLRFSKSCVRILFAKFVQSFERAHALKFYKPIHKLVYSKPVIADIKFSVLAYIALTPFLDVSCSLSAQNSSITSSIT